MKTIALLLTFLLVLELVKAQYTKSYYNLTISKSDSTSYHFKWCTQKKLSQCYNQNFINNLECVRVMETMETMCTCDGDDRTRCNTFTSDHTPSSDLFLGSFECKATLMRTTSSSTPSCTLITPTKCTDSTTTDASTNYVIPSTSSQKGNQSTDGLLSSVTLTPTPSKQLCSGSATNASITQAALGATVGLLAVLLILAIIGWVCTCVILKKKATMNINKTNNRYIYNVILVYLSDPCYDYFMVFVNCLM